MQPLCTIALAGNPNSGKTTAFNALTGGHQHVGNYPGITVEKKEGLARLPGGGMVRVIDLPGTYSLSAYSQEETVARMVLLTERPDVVLDVLNAGALARNLYLAVQLLELGVPVALGLNMMDEARAQGLIIDPERLAARLGCPVLPAVARTGVGVRELLTAAVEHAQARRGTPWQPLVISYGPDLDPALEFMRAAIESSGFMPEAPARWTALKFLEQDEEIIVRCRAEQPELAHRLEDKLDAVAAHLRQTLDTTPEAVIADYRYGYISGLLRDGVLERRESRHSRAHVSAHLDQVLTHPLIGPLIMLGVMYCVYTLTFNLGAVPMGWVESAFGWLRGLCEQNLDEGPLRSLIVSGVIDGVGGVMSFVPLIMIIFLQIAFLEDTGYIARMAYMLDRVFRVFGLHGYSVMPYIVSGGIAGGCAVPGVMAARTLRSPREKLATLLTVPFMACGAKLPVFILFAGVFFPGNEARIMFGLTLTGWAVALIAARILRSTLVRGPATPFVMELPPYRLPTLLGLGIHTLERTLEYMKKAGTVILAISILLWAAMTYPGLPEERAQAYTAESVRLETALSGGALEDALSALEARKSEERLRGSFAGRLGQWLQPATAPAGFDWRTDIALIGGFAAKEVIVATLGTAYSLGEVDPEEPASLAEKIRNDLRWDPATALGLMVFVLLYAPCLVTVVVMRQETGGWRWPVFSMVFNTLVAYGMAVLVRHVALLAGI